MEKYKKIDKTFPLAESLIAELEDVPANKVKYLWRCGKEAIEIGDMKKGKEYLKECIKECERVRKEWVEVSLPIFKDIVEKEKNEEAEKFLNIAIKGIEENNYKDAYSAIKEGLAVIKEEGFIEALDAFQIFYFSIDGGIRMHIDDTVIAKAKEVIERSKEKFKDGKYEEVMGIIGEGSDELDKSKMDKTLEIAEELQSLLTEAEKSKRKMDKFEEELSSTLALFDAGDYELSFYFGEELIRDIKETNEKFRTLSERMDEVKKEIE
ncbi:MAG: hypothetical protein AB1779_08645, partial [Candidatus Thermoplasmatota archaeon]